MVELIDFLREIETITELNGCYFVNIKEKKVIESTISHTPSEDILWEICVLRDTFRQFASGIGHGELNDLMLEGDNGYILVYHIPPNCILLALGRDDINLSYVKLAMLDILDRIKTFIRERGEEVLSPPEEAPMLEVERARTRPSSLKAQVSSKTSTRPQAGEAETPKMTAGTTTPEESIPSPQREEVHVPTAEEISEPTSTTSEVPKEKVKAVNLEEIIDSLGDLDEEQQSETLRKIFETLKTEFKYKRGVEIAEELKILKDKILNNIGTSLALFDLSKCARKLQKIQEKIQPEEIKNYQSRVENWAQRIIK
ncbi:MAG: hypothetical protein R6U96_18970 [Promethearchaeia archaeon]